MAATAAQIARLRRMVDESGTATYTDDDLAEYIEAYPAVDERGELPYSYTTATPPARETNASWMQTYDLAAAAADIWAEKGAVLAQDFDTNADGASLSRSQAYIQAMQQSRFWLSRRKPGTITLVPTPRPVPADDVVGN